MKDMSLLQPLSIKDAIWIECERRIASEDDFKYEESKLKFMDNRFDALYLSLLDLREIERNTNFYQKASALKDAKRPKIEPFPDKHLPSVMVNKQREEKKRTAEQEDAMQKKLIARCVKAVKTGERQVDTD